MKCEPRRRTQPLEAGARTPAHPLALLLCFTLQARETAPPRGPATAGAAPQQVHPKRTGDLCAYELNLRRFTYARLGPEWGSGRSCAPQSAAGS